MEHEIKVFSFFGRFVKKSPGGRRHEEGITPSPFAKPDGILPDKRLVSRTPQDAVESLPDRRKHPRVSVGQVDLQVGMSDTVVIGRPLLGAWMPAILFTDSSCCKQILRVPRNRVGPSHRPRRLPVSNPFVVDLDVPSAT